jgi:hypothetical protein
MNANDSIPPQTPPPIPERPRFNLLLFFAALLTPAVLALFAAMGQVEGLAIGIPLIGGGIAGIICGIMLARRVGRNQGARIGLGFLFSALFGVLSFALGFAGCMAGGFNTNFH